jgi:hypothetical protein
LRKEDVLAPEDGKDEEKAAGEHEQDKDGKDEAVKEWQGGMDCLQSYQRDIPEEKGEKRENQTRQDQQSDEDSFFRRRVQVNLFSSE